MLLNTKAWPDHAITKYLKKSIIYKERSFSYVAHLKGKNLALKKPCILIVIIDFDLCNGIQNWFCTEILSATVKTVKFESR